jgi:hypothetical protein
VFQVPSGRKPGHYCVARNNSEMLCFKNGICGNLPWTHRATYRKCDFSGKTGYRSVGEAPDPENTAKASRKQLRGRLVASLTVDAAENYTMFGFAFAGGGREQEATTHRFGPGRKRNQGREGVSL